MPCSPGMTKCRRDCLHRAMVESYRAASAAEDLQIEAETNGYTTEQAERGRRLTFKAWLQSWRTPSPDDFSFASIDQGARDVAA